MKMKNSCVFIPNPDVRQQVMILVFSRKYDPMAGHDPKQKQKGWPAPVPKARFGRRACVRARRMIG